MMEEENQADDNQDVEVRCHARVSAGRSPSERSLHSCTLLTVDGCRIVYLYGGRSKNGQALDDLHVLDLEANYWSLCKPKSDKPAGRFGHCGEAFEGNLYIFGGQSRGQATFKFQGDQPPSSMFSSDKKAGKREADTEVTDQLLQYSTESMMWDELDFKGGDACPVPRYKHASCLVPERRGQARMYVFGGQDEEGLSMDDEYFLDMKTLTWTRPTTSGTKPSARYGHTVTLIPAKRNIIVLGGTDGKQLENVQAPDPEFPPHKTTKSLHNMTVYCLDIDNATWSTITCKNAGTGAEPSPRAYHSATLLGKNLFVTGGQVHYWLLANNHYIHGAYILEIVKNQWEHNTIKGDSFIPYPGCSLLGHSACSIDSSSLVIFGGSLEATSGLECVNTFWDVATDAKQKLHSSQLPLPTPSGAYSTTFKLLVVGDAGVGKTCLITRFVDDVFSSTCKSTIGVDFKATTIEMDGKAVQLQVWDTAGQERFRALTTSYYRGAHGVILVYDVTEQASFDHLASWIKDVDLYSGEEVTKLLIGNKDDNHKQKVVDPELAREFAKDHSMLFMEASAMRSLNVTAAFKLLVAEVMHQADTLASQPPAFEHKLKVNQERSRRASGGCSCGI
mmetsp:Transcript_8767/g.23148  ORF Transcript_8767/g.23148 Transcript_8767/m.23148 type:complete len:618 (-) Transcript_8767:71-1924(-)